VRPTANSGEFSIDRPTGTYRAMVTALGYETFTTQEVPVEAGSQTRHEGKLAHVPPILARKVARDRVGILYARPLERVQFELLSCLPQKS